MSEQHALPLAQRLRQASARQLRELIALHAAELSLTEARQALLNPWVDATAIDELASVRRLMAIDEVRSALARHPRTPEVVAMRLLPGLFWRDLLETSLDVRVRSGVRTVAEGYLVKRLARLSVGEKITLARRAGHGVLATLRHDPSPRVIAALLENPRLTEATLLPMVTSERTPPGNLALVAQSPRWGCCYDLRSGLARNPQAFLRTALAVLPALRRGDLETIAATERLSPVVRHEARELLAQRS